MIVRLLTEMSTMHRKNREHIVVVMVRLVVRIINGLTELKELEVNVKLVSFLKT